MTIKKTLKKFGLALLITGFLAVIAPTTFAENSPESAKQDCKEGPCDPGKMLESLNQAKQFIEALKNLKIEDDAITEAIKKTAALMIQAEDILKNEDRDLLEEIQVTTDEQMAYIFKYLELHPDLMEKLKDLTPRNDDDFSDGKVMKMPRQRYLEGIFEERRDEKEFSNYFDHMPVQMEDKVFRKIMRDVNAELMKELPKYLKDEQVNEIVGNIMGSIDVFGEEFTNEILRNQTTLFKNTDDFDPSRTPYRPDKITELYNRARNTVIPDGYTESLSALWTKLRTVMESGSNTGKFDAGSRKAIDAVLQELETAIDDMDRENVLGEKPVEFFDVSFKEHAWYWKPVMEARQSGIVNGYRDEKGPTGYFGPADDVTYAQALKMIMEASGHHREQQVDRNSGGDQIWYLGYLDDLDALNLPELSSKSFENWDSPATREEVLLMINRVFAIQPVSYSEGTFTDVRSGDEIADAAMASYLAGIFTGEGDTGKLNANGRINRAGFAKVINAAAKYLNGNNLVDRLDNFDEKDDFKLQPEEEALIPGI